MSIPIIYIIACGALLFAYGWYASSLLHSLREKREQKKAANRPCQPSTYRKGFTQGLNLGMQKFGQHIRNNFNPHIHGFAIMCDKCQSCIATFHDVRMEYIRCPRCNHRNPTPIPEEDSILTNDS